MRLKKYSSDISAKGWQVIEKIIQVNRKSKWDLQEILNGILYLTKNGCTWRDLPSDFPCWITVYWYFRKWVKDGTWKAINDCLVVDCRVKLGKSAQPTVAIVDSQSVKSSNFCNEKVGVDGGKLVKGRKRFYFVDTMGNLLDSFVESANSYDGTTSIKYWASMSCQNILLDNINKIYADGTFGGTFSEKMKDNYRINVEIPKIPIAKKGSMEIHPKRWVVERTIAWTNSNRRCSKDYERKTQNANAYLIITNIRRLAKKLT